MLNPDYRDMLSAFYDERVEYMIVGAPLQDLTQQDLCSAGIVFQIGVAPRRIDVLTAIDGVTFEEAWPRRMEVDTEGIQVSIIGRDDLI